MKNARADKTLCVIDTWSALSSACSLWFFGGVTLPGRSPAEPVMPRTTNRKNAFIYQSRCKGTAFSWTDQIFSESFTNFNVYIKIC